jgi:hypothetical protein
MGDAQVAYNGHARLAAEVVLQNPSCFPPNVAAAAQLWMSDFTACENANPGVQCDIELTWHSTGS